MLLLLGTVTVAEVKVQQSRDDDLRETTPTNWTLVLMLTLVLTLLVMEAVVSGRITAGLVVTKHLYPGLLGSVLGKLLMELHRHGDGKTETVRICSCKTNVTICLNFQA